MQELRRHDWPIRREERDAGRDSRKVPCASPLATYLNLSQPLKKTTFSTTSHRLPATLAVLNMNLTQTMATTTIQSGRLADVEDSSLSSLDSEPRSSFETRAHEKTGDEEALVPPNQQSREEGEQSSSGSLTKLLLWMLANTLATVGIVRTRIVSSNTKISETLPNQSPPTPDLYQQNALLSFPFQTRPGQLRVLPLLHDRDTTLPSLTPAIWIFRAKTGQTSRNATIGRSDVSERNIAKLLTRLLLHSILSNLPRAPHPYRRCNQLLYVPEDAASNGHLCPCSDLRRCGNGYVL